MAVDPSTTMNDYTAFPTDSTEHIALKVRRARRALQKPLILAALAFAFYATLGVPALRMETRGPASRCITLTGEKFEIWEDVPVLFCVKDGKITFPRMR